MFARFLPTLLILTSCGAPKSARLTETPDGACLSKPVSSGTPEAPGLFVQGRHMAAIRDLDFALDGRLASASEDGSVRIWDPNTRRSLAVFRATQGGDAGSVAWHPDGQRLIAGIGFDQYALAPGQRARQVFAVAVSRLSPVAGGRSVKWIGNNGDWAVGLDEQGQQQALLKVPPGGAAPFARVEVSKNGEVAALVG